MSLSDTANALNKSGSFLQILVMHELDKAVWHVDSEFPVQAAPFTNDPIKHELHTKIDVGKGIEIIYHPHNLVKAISACQNKIELQETVIDVIGATGRGGKKSTFKLCIECKKLDPDYSDWIFFAGSSKGIMNLITKNIKSEGFASLFKIPGTSLCGNEINVDLSKFDLWSPFTHMISNNSIAISNEKIDKNTYKTKKSLIDNACRQIIEGTYGFILNEVQHQILSAEGYEDKRVVFVPIVITTANLKICNVDPSDIDTNTGYIKKEPIYEPVDSIIYECTPPKSVRFPHPDYTNLRLEHRRAVQKWHVLIFSPKGFTNFLQKLHDTELVW